jgi:hypothetical protein
VVGWRNKQAIIFGLLPVRVDSGLSKPYQSNIKGGKIITPKYFIKNLSCVLENLAPKKTGKCFIQNGEKTFP